MEKRAKQVGVRVNPEERGLIDRAAKKESRTYSDWARLVLLDRARAVLSGEASPILPPNDEEALWLATLTEIDGRDPALRIALLDLGSVSRTRPHVAPLLKELAAVVRGGEPPSIVAPIRKGPRRPPRAAGKG